MPGKTSPLASPAITKSTLSTGRASGFVAADGRQIFVCPEGLRTCSVRLHTQGGHRHIEAHDLRNRHRRSAGYSPGSGKARHRDIDHRRRLRPLRQASVYVREPAEPEGRTIDGSGPLSSEQKPRRHPRKRVQKRPAPGSAVRCAAPIQGRHVARLGLRRNNDGGCLLTLLRALFAGPEPLRIEFWSGWQSR